MQYGHCVVNATASAMSSLYFRGMAPSFIATSLRVAHAAIPSGASSLSVLIFFMFAASYIMAVSSLGVEVANQPANVLGRVQQTPDAGEQVRPLRGARRKPFELLEQPADV